MSSGTERGGPHAEPSAIRTELVYNVSANGVAPSRLRDLADEWDKLRAHGMPGAAITALSITNEGGRNVLRVTFS